MLLTTSWEELEPFLRNRRGQGDSSIANHKCRFNILKKWFEGRDFTANNFDLFLFSFEKEGKSSSWINNNIKLVRHIAAYLKIKEEFADFKYRDDYGGQPENILTPDQIKALAEAKIKYFRYKNRKEKIRALIYFLGTVGSRISETLSLKVSDIKIDGNINLIHFRKETTKTKSERYVPMPKWLVEILLSAPRENDFLFPKIDGPNFRRDLEKRRILCGIPFKVTPHTFRDSVGNNKLDADVPLQEVTNILGHSTPVTTYKYYTRIQAKKVAKSLIQKDPAFIDDQTYELALEALKRFFETSLCERVCNKHFRTENVDGKTIEWFGISKT